MVEEMKWPKDEKGTPYIIDATSLVRLVEQNQSGEQTVITLLLNLNLMVQALCLKADSVKDNEYKDANLTLSSSKEGGEVYQRKELR